MQNTVLEKSTVHLSIFILFKNMPDSSIYLLGIDAKDYQSIPVKFHAVQINSAVPLVRCLRRRKDRWKRAIKRV